MKPKRAFVILFCMIYLLGSCVSFLPYLYYKVNKEYVIQNLCENKGNQEMQCEGKCFIAKEIIELNQQQEEHNHSEQVAQQTGIFPHERILVMELIRYENILLLDLMELNDMCLSPILDSVFLPPENLG